MKHFPIIEIYGPTLQGEGSYIGRRCYFVRIGGCDYRCTWCDSMFAVDPEQVKANATYMGKHEIGDKLSELGAAIGDTIVLSGGNPAMHNLEELVNHLKVNRNFFVHIETQGSIGANWLANVDHVTISPKPPSSGRITSKEELKGFLMKWYQGHRRPAVLTKYVIFDDADYAYAVEMCNTYPFPTVFQCGTLGKETVEETLVRLRWLAEKVAQDPSLKRITVLPQLHVLIWSHERAR